MCCCVCLSLSADCATAAPIAICLHCTCIQAAVVAVVWCFVVTGVSCRWAQVADACIQFGREWLLHLLRCRVVWAACVMWQAGGAASAASAAPGSLHVVASVMSAVNSLATKCWCRQCTAQQCAASVLRYTTAVFPACFFVVGVPARPSLCLITCKALHALSLFLPGAGVVLTCCNLPLHLLCRLMMPPNETYARHG